MYYHCTTPATGSQAVVYKIIAGGVTINDQTAGFRPTPEAVNCLRRLDSILAAGSVHPLTAEELAELRQGWLGLLQQAGMGMDVEAYEPFVAQLRQAGVMLPPDMLGRLEWFLYRDDYNRITAGPFNGQWQRQAIVHDISASCPFQAVVETGTYRGDSTAVLAEETGAPVFSAEIDPRSLAYARLRYADDERIFFSQQDSRLFLRDLARHPFFPRQQVFFYLDAHWGEDLPLYEEIKLIVDTWQESVIMIDDFQVPGDEGYGYDDYGAGRTLSLSYLHLDKLPPLSLYWPAASAAEESGFRRGCLVLAAGRESAHKLDAIKTLRPAQQ